jgi:hypothetical protein
VTARAWPPVEEAFILHRNQEWMNLPGAREVEAGAHG